MSTFLSPPALAGQGNTLQNAQNLFGISPEAFSQLGDLKSKFNITPDDLLTMKLLDRLNPEETRIAAERGYELQLKAAKEAQKLGKESLAYTSMMNQINNLPGTIASAFGGAGERELMQNLYGKIPEVVSETYRTFPRMQIQPVAYGMPSSRYFS